MSADQVPAPGRPSAWVLRFAPLVPSGGRVLDLACGGGRHTGLFLRAGHPVTAVDREPGGLAHMAGTGELTVVTADLEAAPWPFPELRFAAIVVTNYLHRPLLPLLRDAVVPGGVLIYETFAVGNERFGRPRNPDFLLRPGELLALACDGLEAVAYEHGVVDRPRPAVVQRLCAVRGSAAERRLDPG